MKKIKITESTFSRIMERMLKEEVDDLDTPIIEKLKNTLTTWENKEYPSDETRWKEYYKDIEKIVKKYENN